MASVVLVDLMGSEKEPLLSWFAGRESEVLKASDTFLTSPSQGEENQQSEQRKELSCSQPGCVELWQVDPHRNSQNLSL